MQVRYEAARRRAILMQPRVHRASSRLLAAEDALPFPDNSMDAVYTEHALLSRVVRATPGSGQRYGPSAGPGRRMAPTLAMRTDFRVR